MLRQTAFKFHMAWGVGYTVVGVGLAVYMFITGVWFFTLPIAALTAFATSRFVRAHTAYRDVGVLDDFDRRHDLNAYESHYDPGGFPIMRGLTDDVIEQRRAARERFEQRRREIREREQEFRSSMKPIILSDGKKL